MDVMGVVSVVSHDPTERAGPDKEVRGVYSKYSRPGETNPSAKLRELDIRYIFALRKLGHSGEAIAEEFGVRHTSISNVLIRRTWKNVEIEVELLTDWAPRLSKTIGQRNPSWRGGVVDSYLYSTWAGIKQRTTNPNNPSWERYGGRGVSLAPEWLDDSTAFISWVEENLGPRSDGMSLDRIDNDGNYEKGNLRWASRSIQNINKGYDPINGFMGISKWHNKWKAAISYENTALYLGLYDTKEEAASVRDDVAFIIHGSDAVLNFPDRQIGISSTTSVLEQLSDYFKNLFDSKGADQLAIVKPCKRRVDASRRRALLKGITVTLTHEELNEAFDDLEGMCFWGCGRAASTIEHIFPLQPKAGELQGHHIQANVVLACKFCNSAKHNSDPFQYWITVRDGRIASFDVENRLQVARDCCLSLEAMEAAVT